MPIPETSNQKANDIRHSHISDEFYTTKAEFIWLFVWLAYNNYFIRSLL